MSGTSAPAVLVAAVVVGIILGATLFYAAPRSAGEVMQISSTQTGLSTSSSSQIKSQPSTAAGGNNLILALFPTSRILGPGFSQDFNLLITPIGQFSGRYSLSPFGIVQGFSVAINPNSFDPATGQQALVVTIHADSQLAPGTYPIGISARGASGNINQTFNVQLVQHLIQIAGDAFSPSTITVSAGSQVVWISLDGLMGDMPVTHQIQFSSVAGSSPILRQYDSWTYTFSTPGQYKYYDALDPGLTGVITVTP